jgi:hypothetical protein
MAAEPSKQEHEEAQETVTEDDADSECPICKFVEAGPCKLEHQVRSLLHTCSCPAPLSDPAAIARCFLCFTLTCVVYLMKDWTKCRKDCQQDDKDFVEECKDHVSCWPVSAQQLHLFQLQHLPWPTH